MDASDQTQDYARGNFIMDNLSEDFDERVGNMMFLVMRCRTGGDRRTSSFLVRNLRAGELSRPKGSEYIRN